jgi:hypothetical protein
MKILAKIVLALTIMIIAPFLQPAFARSHGAADGSCDDYCEARNECSILNDLFFDNEDVFYLEVEYSNKPLVRSYCVFGEGLII